MPRIIYPFYSYHSRQAIVFLCKVTAVGSVDSGKTLSAPVNNVVSGLHDVYVLFRGLSDKELFDKDWWQLSEK